MVEFSDFVRRSPSARITLSSLDQLVPVSLSPFGNITSFQHRDDGQGFIAATGFYTSEEDTVETRPFAFRDSPRTVDPLRKQELEVYELKL